MGRRSPGRSRIPVGDHSQGSRNSLASRRTHLDQQPHPHGQPPPAERVAPRTGQPPQQPHPQGQPYPQGVAGYGQPAAAPKRRWGLIALFAVIVIVLGVGIGWGAATLFPKDSDVQSAAASSEEPKGEENSGGDSSAAASEAPEPSETESELPDDPKKALKQLAAADGKEVKSELDGKWVPQLSSKKTRSRSRGQDLGRRGDPR
jgi:hypothetical protein